MDNTYEPTYKIPQDILDKIPDYFWAAFAGELVAMFGPYIFRKDEDGYYDIDFGTGTGGWSVALRATCKRMDMDWLISYYTSLSWDESDLFDDELVGLLIKKFIESYDDIQSNCCVSCGTDYRNIYYRWLVNQVSK